MPIQNLNQNRIPPEEQYRQPGAFEHGKKNWFALHHLVGYTLLAAIFCAFVAVAYYYETVQSLPRTWQQVVHKDPTADWKTYTNAEYGFEFKYPSSINVNDCGGSSNVLLNGICDSDAPVNAMLKVLNPGEVKFNNANSSQITFGGISAKKIDGVGSNNPGGDDVKTEQIIFDRDNKEYNFIFFEDSSGSLKYADQILSTFKFLGTNLAGDDKDNDGVWDYIQNYINTTYPNSQKTKLALIQFAIAKQDYILDWEDKAKATQDINESFNAWNCLAYFQSDLVAAKMISELDDVIINTPERFWASGKSDSQISGSALPRIIHGGIKADCNFDTDKLPN